MKIMLLILMTLFLFNDAALDDSEVMDREKRGDADVVCDMRLSENSRCVIVMTNLAFAPVGRKWIFW